MAGPGRRSAPVQRASANDLMELASDVGPVPLQVAAVLVLSGPAPGLAQVRQALAERLPAVPRLRQRLRPAPPGCGRPVWVDDPHVDIARHVGELRCPPPGGEPELLAAAAALAARPPPPDAPPWAAHLVTGLAGGRAALVMVVHHVLTDGVGGLAVLGALVDGNPAPAGYGFPRPAPPRRALLRDALATRARSLATLPRAAAVLRAALAELRPGQVRPAPRCSLNRPTGTGRRLAVARADLAAVRRVAHARGGTVNDVVLTAVGGALGAVLRRRGESVDRLVVSVPVSGRRQATADRLGNQVGVMPVEVPTGGDALDRLSAVARTTRAGRARHRGGSAALLAPAFRVLARLGLLGPAVNRQRLVNTFVTNLRGPTERLSFLGTPVAEVIPISSAMGNVSTAFAVLSYAGTLVVTTVSDTDGCPELPLLAAELQRQLDLLTRAAAAG
jgi:diacylglycerol O-acyltransferase / wax synthase